MSPWAIPLAMAASAAWAIGMTAAKPGICYVDRLSYTLYRWILVTVLALAYGLARGALSFPGIVPVLWAAVAGFIDAALGGFVYLMAMERTSAHQTTTLSSTAPLWGVFSAVLFLREPLQGAIVAAAFLVVAGSAFLVRRKDELHRNALSGAMLALLTAFLWGFSETVPTKMALQGGLGPETLLLVFACAGALGALLMVPLLRHRVPKRVEPRGFLYVLLSAGGGAFFGWLFWLNSLALAPASVLSPIRGLTLLFAFAYSVFFLRERPTRRALLGTMLVLSGVVLVSIFA